VRRTWLSPQSIALHLTILVLEGGFGALTWWQLGRALSGNTLSWFYALEWPFFGLYALYMWWSLLEREPRADRALAIGVHTPASTTGPPRHEPPLKLNDKAREADEELAAYNRYLAELSASGKRKTWRDSA
jgi:hypothetical protein